MDIPTPIDIAKTKNPNTQKVYLTSIFLAS